MPAPKHILIIRFSALGDVAMTVPVIRNLLYQYPELRVTMVSDPFMQPLFADMERLRFYPADTKKAYRGIRGLYRLASLIRQEVDFDAIADLHDVLRTKVLRFFLGKKTAVINKGRKEKKELTRPVNKKLRQLKTGFERYADVFFELWVPLQLDRETGIRKPETGTNLISDFGDDRTFIFIGIAPFARHKPKMYPLEKMKELVDMLSNNDRIKIVLIGSKDEAGLLETWAAEKSNIRSIAGKTGFADELKTISSLDLMVSMDSANMHLASLYGVPVISVWGGTHPYLGFYGWGQDPANAVQLDLPCRPSSVFGNKPCPTHGEEGCMQGISPSMIQDRIYTALKIN